MPKIELVEHINVSFILTFSTGEVWYTSRVGMGRDDRRLDGKVPRDKLVRLKGLLDAHLGPAAALPTTQPCPRDEYGLSDALHALSLCRHLVAREAREGHPNDRGQMERLLAEIDAQA